MLANTDKILSLLSNFVIIIYLFIFRLKTAILMGLFQVYSIGMYIYKILTVKILIKYDMKIDAVRMIRSFCVHIYPPTQILHIALHTHAKVHFFVSITRVYIFIRRIILYALSWDRVDFICWLRSVLTQTQYAHPSLLSLWGLSIDRYVFDIEAIKYSILQPPQKTFCDFTFSLRHYWICLFICFPSVDCWLFSTL